MPDIFDIGVKLSLASNVGAGLRVLARDLMGIRDQAGLTQASLDRLRTVMLGAAAFTAGSALLRGWWDLAKAGDRIIQQRQKMLSMGIDQVTVQKNYVAALRAAAAIEGTTVSGNMATITLLRSIIGTSAQARAILPGTARDTWILRHLGQSTGDIAALYKALDVKGFGINEATGQLDPKKFIRSLDLLTAALNLMPHQILRGLGIYQFVRMAAPIGQLGGDPMAFIRNTFELMAQLGRTGGRGIAYMGIKLLGGQLTKAQVATLLRDKLVSPSGIGGTREHPFLKAGAIKGYQELLHKGLLAWFRDVLFPSLGIKPGDKSIGNLQKLLHGLAGFPVTSQRAAGTLVTILPMVARFNEQLDKELPHLDETFNTLQTSVVAQLGDLGSALDSFFEVLGVPAAQAAIPWLKSITGAIQDMTLTIGQNPWLPGVIDALAESIGLLLSLEGGIAVARGAFGMLRLAIPGLAKAFGPFAAGGFAAVALRILTRPTGLFALALGIEALGKALPSIPKWLIHLVSGQMMAIAAAKIMRLPGAMGLLFDLSGDTNSRWVKEHPLSEAQKAKERAEFRAAGIAIPQWLARSLPLPPLPPALPLPPLPPSRGGAPVQITIHSAPNVTLPLPPMSPGDIERALQRALIQGLDATTLERIADELAKREAHALDPLLQKAIEKHFADAAHKRDTHLKRRSFVGPPSFGRGEGPP